MWMVVGYICIIRKIFYHIVKKIHIHTYITNDIQDVVKYFYFSTRFCSCIEQQKIYSINLISSRSYSTMSVVGRFWSHIVNLLYLVTHIKDQLINTNCYFKKNCKFSFFLFWHLYMLNQVEFLLFQTTVYLHRKKRKHNTHNTFVMSD